MKKKRKLRLLAYILMPVIFTIIGYVLLAIALKPVLNMGVSTINMFMADRAPEFNEELKSIYDPYAPKAAEPQTDEATDTEYIQSYNFEFPEHNDRYGELICERLGLRVAVYWGDSDEILEYGAGTYAGSLPPGYGEMTLIAGHNLTYFAPFKDAEVGDTIEFRTYYADYVYKVREVSIFDERDLQRYVLDGLFDKDELILYTCYPFEAVVGRKTDRLTLICDRISGPDIHWKGRQDE